jgi:ribosome-associated protein
MALTPTVQARAKALPDPVRVQAEPDTGQLVRNILNSLDDAKAEDVISIDLHGKTSIADAMVIASGRSTTHVSAIADRVIKGCKDAGFQTPRVEGLPHCDWVLVDAGDVIVHLFRPEVRQFYNLEKMWGGDRPTEEKAPRRA